MARLSSLVARFRTRRSGWVRALPCGAMNGFLRRASAPLQVTLQRLPAAVAAKQNGFWQIVG
ncbi:hypothetical protein C2H86_14990 [Pseudomonas putida]|uniref:Uncharacterized protein n=1 Tax=Pseudomonas putida TaxID=303 RepID=A0A6I6Y021_PSEPU|nr:hypothetical protein C2H86_14990 [Pseudomonas putida]